MITGIAHIAIAVKDIDESLRFWRDGLGLEFKGVENLANEGVKTAFLLAGSGKSGAQCPAIELLQSDGDGIALSRFMEKRGKGGIHHIAFRVDDLQKEIQRMKSSGYRLLEPCSRPGARGTRVAFLDPKSSGGTLVELVEENRKDG